MSIMQLSIDLAVKVGQMAISDFSCYATVIFISKQPCYRHSFLLYLCILLVRMYLKVLKNFLCKCFSLYLGALNILKITVVHADEVSCVSC